MISISDLFFAYSKTDQAINGISLDIKDGEWVSIIGHNGSGKSTLSKLLVGLIKADKGEIRINDVLLTEETVNECRKHVGIIFQNPDNQFVGVTVKHDIAFGLENKKIERNLMHEKVKEFAAKVGMEAFLDSEPHHLSGGQKQRVAIAGVLAMDTDIMILDESTSMLDPEGVKEIVSLLKELKSLNKIMITITHDLDIAALSDRVIVLDNGKVILDGKPHEIFENVEILQKAKLDIPFNLKLYNEVINDPILKENKELIDTLWELSLMK